MTSSEGSHELQHHERETTVYVAHEASRLASLAAALRERGFAVTEMPGSVLSERALQHAPDAIVLDTIQTGAEEALARLDAEPTLKIPVVLVGAAGLVPPPSLRKPGRPCFASAMDQDEIVLEVARLIASAKGASAANDDLSADDSFPVASGPDLVGSLIPIPAAAGLPSGLPFASSAPPGPGSLLPGSDPSAWMHGPLAGPTSMSAALERLLAEAEQRVMAEHVSTSDVPSPDEEVDALLPPDVLAALDEPLEPQVRSPSSSPSPDMQSVHTPTGTGAHLTSADRLTSAGSTHVRGETKPGRVDDRLAETGEFEPEEDAPEEDAPEEDAPEEEDEEAEENLPEEDHPTPPPVAIVMRADAPTRPPSHGPPRDQEAEERRVPTSPVMAKPVLDTTHAPLPVEPDEGTPTPAPSALVTARSVSPSTLAANPPPPPMIPAAPLLPSIEPAEPAHSSSVQIPEVLTPQFDGMRALARSIAGRASFTLCFEDGPILRRAVMRDGDFVTCSSSAPHESLVAFLVAKGDLSRELGTRLGSKLPPFGRHAAAALIANGHLAQDQLWPVLRAHAEWLLGSMARTKSGVCAVEADPPGRLKAEPAVFGGATGAEVFIEVAMRVLTSQDAIARLGGGKARLVEGPQRTLIAECALSEADREAVKNSAGMNVQEALRAAGRDEIAPVLAALAELAVVEALPSVGRDSVAPDKDSVDQLDAEAVRRRVEARLAVVQEGDYFEVLGVSPQATSYEIRRAYLDMRHAFEPSRLLTAATAELADDVQLILEVVEEAWEALRDPSRRERYLRALRANPPQ